LKAVLKLIGIVGLGVQLGPLGTAATNRPGKPKYSGKTCPNPVFSPTNHTCCPDAKPDRRGGKPAINRLSHGTALF
jgi:hypothetical protein